MGLFGKKKPHLVTVNRRPLHCVVCSGQYFWRREVVLNTSGAEFLGWGFANKSALGLDCTSCGYVHQFVGDAVELWKPDGGYPGDAR